MAAILSRLMAPLEKSNVYALLIGGLAIVTLALWQFQSYRPRDPREPPILPAKIPYIGHLLGLIIHQAEYFQQLAYVARMLSNIF